MLNKKTKAYAALISAVFFWGLAPIFSKSMLNFYSPMLCSGLECIAALCVLFPISIKSLKGIQPKALKGAAGTAIIWALAEIFYIVGLNYTTPAKAALYENCTVIVVPILLVMLGTKQNPWKFISAAVCFIGIALVGFDGNATALFSFTIGDLLIFLAGVFYGIDIIFSKKHLENVEPKLYMLIRLIVLAIFSFGGAFTIEKRYFSFEWTNLLLLFFVGVLRKAYCWSMRNYSLKELEPNVCALMMPFSAIIAGFVSVLLSMDVFSWQLLVGGILIVVALFLSDIKEIIGGKKKKRESKGETECKA